MIFIVVHPLTTTRKSPAVRELLKPSTDSASLLGDIEKEFFILGLKFSEGNVTSRGVFVLFWPSLPGPGAVQMSHFRTQV